MPRKRITFIVIPPNDGLVQEYRFSSTLMWMGGLLFMGFVCALGYYTSGYYTRVDQREEIAALQRENANLTKGLDRTKKKVNNLELAMQDLADDDQRLRNWHQMLVLTPEDRIGGMGGPDLPEEDYALLPIRKRELLVDLAGRIERQHVQVRQLEDSFDKIGNEYMLSVDSLRFMPTISPVAPPPELNWKSSRFGRRNDPFTGTPTRHLGLDIAGRRGTPIYATADGVVRYAFQQRKDRPLGNVVVINHSAEGVNDKGEPYEIPGFYRTEYGHLDEMLVKKGDRVKRGQQIATMGSTGRSTGPHLHYAVRYQQRKRGGIRGYLDPQDFLLDWPDDDSVVDSYLARIED